MGTLLLLQFLRQARRNNTSFSASVKNLYITLTALIALLLPSFASSTITPSISQQQSSVLPSIQQVQQANPGIAFYYQNDLTPQQATHYGKVVLHVEDYPVATIEAMQNLGVKVFAYVSIGEISEKIFNELQLDSSWQAGTNAQWNSVTVLANKQWLQWWQQRVYALAKRYPIEGFFIDTIDSLNTESDAQKLEISDSILNIKKQTGKKLLLNRGFSWLSSLATGLDGLVVESLFHTWNTKQQGYQETSHVHQQHMLKTLTDIRKKYQLNIVVIDYHSPGNMKDAIALSLKIHSLGFVPYITNKQVSWLGVSNRWIMPRDVLVLYDPNTDPIREHPAHAKLGVVLEYLGLTPLHVASSVIPDYASLKHRFAGVIIWESNPREFDRDMMLALEKIFDQTLTEKVPLVVLGSPALLSPIIRARMGLAGIDKPSKIYQTQVLSDSTLMGPFETKRHFSKFALPWIKNISDDNQKLLSLNVNQGEHEIIGGVLGDWGGVAFDPFITQAMITVDSRWVMQPMQFLKLALKLPEWPVPDASTENNKRVMTIHIDGDGFNHLSEVNPKLTASQVLYNEVLKRYKWPTTVSVISSEMVDNAKAQKTAKAIFDLAHIQGASHTHSHPFDWQSLPAEQSSFESWMKQETLGSIQWINENLLPQHKQSNLLLLSGSANPHDFVFDLLSAHDIEHINGGNTHPDFENASLTYVYPNVLKTANYQQIYAPITNEIVYTDHWRGPFYGFRKVIETFELTESPWRLKPFTLYYHFYSADKKAGLEALQEIYHWLDTQPKTPLTVSQFISRMQGVYQATLSMDHYQNWCMAGAAKLRTLRLSDSLSNKNPNIKNLLPAKQYGDRQDWRYLSIAQETLCLKRAALESTQQNVKSNSILRNYQASQLSSAVNSGMLAHWSKAV